MQYTTNYNLKKPEGTDPVFIGDFNDNSDIIDSALADKQGALVAVTVTLASADWSGGTQTVSVTGVTSTSIVWVSPDPASAAGYAENGILCTAQGTDTLTFSCSTAPSGDLTVNIVYGG